MAGSDREAKPPVFFELFRLITPLLILVVMFMLENIWSELQRISLEQARRTVIVEKSWEHLQDTEKHK